MRKLVISFLFTLFAPIAATAQSYLVYTVTGDVTLNAAGRARRLNQGDIVTGKTVISVPEGSRLTLVSEKNDEMYTLKVPSTGALQSLLSAKGNISQGITKNYLAFIKEKISSKGQVKDINYMQSAGTAYRSVGGRYTPLPEAEPGKLLQPLRNACEKAKVAFESNDIDGLLAAADEIEALGLCRYDFNLTSGYTPCSFNGFLVYDPTCLRDLAANLDPSTPFAEQIKKLPVPMAKDFNSRKIDGNILCNNYVLGAGEYVTLEVECDGYCEVVAINANITVEYPGHPAFSSADSTHFILTENQTVKITLNNVGNDPDVVFFGINR